MKGLLLDLMAVEVITARVLSAAVATGPTVAGPSGEKRAEGLLYALVSLRATCHE